MADETPEQPTDETPDADSPENAESTEAADTEAGDGEVVETETEETAAAEADADASEADADAGEADADAEAAPDADASDEADEATTSDDDSEAQSEPAADVEEAATTDESESSDESAAPSDDLGELTIGGDVPIETPAPKMPTIIRGKIDRFGVAMGTGRRKTSVARVRIKDGDGKLTINGRALDDYFTTERDRNMIEAPLKSTDSFGNVDVWVRVNGGGTTGQAGAIVLGIARALQARNPTLHEILSEGRFLTRDGRMVERKKYGYKKARKSFQFSKR